MRGDEWDEHNPCRRVGRERHEVAGIHHQVRLLPNHSFLPDAPQIGGQKYLLSAEKPAPFSREPRKGGFVPLAARGARGHNSTLHRYTPPVPAAA